MADGQLESIWPQLYNATRTLSPVRLVLKVTLFLLLHCKGVFLCLWGVLTRLDFLLVPCSLFLLFSEPPPEGGLDLVTNRKGAI